MAYSSINSVEWRKPVFTFGPNEGNLRRNVEHNGALKTMNISDSDWEKHCQTVNEVLNKVSKHIKQYAQNDYEGLVLDDSFIKFGSSRDGLKVVDALEFDCMMVFDIRGMQITPITATKDNTGKRNPGFLKIRVENGYELKQRYSWLARREILIQENGYFYFHTRNLQEKVFKSLVDKARQNLNDQLDELSSSFSIVRISKPPTLDIHISIDETEDISNLRDDLVRLQSSRVFQAHAYNEARQKVSLQIDLVPALLIRTDLVPNPDNRSMNMYCPVYAVMKWAHKGIYYSAEGSTDQLWREDTSGLEKHVIDVAVQREEPSQRYLLTACRILKAYVANLPGHNQLHVVMASQYLKTLCLHSIVMLTVPGDQNCLSGVYDALGYLLYFLELCITNKNLPHFFYGNPGLVLIFPHAKYENEKTNLYQGISDETFRQANLYEVKENLRGLFEEFYNLDTNRVARFRDLLGITH